MAEDKKQTEKKVDEKKIVKEESTESRKEEKKKTVVKTEIKPKEKAVAKGFSLRISPKYSFGACKMIKNRSPDRALEMLKEVVAGKRAVLMKGREVPHQKSRGMKGVAGGRFPKKTAEEFIRLVEQVRANAVVNGIDNPIITIAKADKASSPFRTGGRKGKRTHVYIEVRSFGKRESKKNSDKLKENKK